MSSYDIVYQIRAADLLRQLLDKPVIPDRNLLGDNGYFDPWEMFPGVLGGHSSEFDDCAVEVLSEICAGIVRRSDLGSEMFREMLCASGLCDYKTSPRTCSATRQFKLLLPEYLAKWHHYRTVRWSERV